MKTFKDLEFKPHPAGDGVMVQEHFDNGYGVSVIRTEFTYGGKKGLYELAVLKDGEIHYDNPVAKGDVVGWLTENDVTELMDKIQKI